MVKETFASRGVQGKRFNKIHNLEEDLSKISVEQGRSGLDEPVIGREIPYSNSFLATYQEGGNSYMITISLHCPTELLAHLSKEGERLLYMTLEAKTMGEGELKPSSIPTLAEIIEKYGFMDPTVFYTP